MQRKAVRRVLPGIAVLTALVAGMAGLTGCTGGGSGGGDTDSKSGDSSPAPAPAGKYRSLPSPCRSVDGKRLRAMLPAAPGLTEEDRERIYAGTADTSYDADRHVGCRWSAQTPEETRLLAVGFERVVSYDRTTMSDDDKARQVYVRSLTDARLPFPGPAATPGAPASPGAAPASSPPPAAPPASPPAAATGAPPASGSPAPGSGAPTPSPSPSELGSRVLEGLGAEAFIEDKLGPAGASAAQSRTVRVVFRTANVIVTVEYSVQPAVPGAVPSSTETQDKARQLAQALVERFSD
ncbi:hypothetical protein SUDANB120_03592 [Streptomyces sp. enrichment culture]|uniref:DUF3558 domain-containing protein n=1 Tax=Streptomyces TaxID=1883 RepID=UPI0016783FBE|nr:MULTISPECIES: DUF3558 domain-containing protein [Streptomyces]MBD3580373.1 DUF3558 domain-containing protein [Streptomyces sp. KD18]GGT28476.1 hypothetical protein GCM10010286_62320 [Streptomyces toxytricini]